MDDFVFLVCGRLVTCPHGHFLDSLLQAAPSSPLTVNACFELPLTVRFYIMASLNLAAHLVLFIYFFRRPSRDFSPCDGLGRIAYLRR